MDIVKMKPEEAKNRIVDAIKLYQKRHPGWSPSDDLLAREVQIPVGEVKYFIGQLEKEDRIGIVGKWPRTLWVKDETKVADPTEDTMKPKRVSPTLGKKYPNRKRTPRKPFLYRARQVGEELARMEKAGEKPYVTTLSERLYGRDTAGYTCKLMEKMREEGWITKAYKGRGDAKLTALGREVLLHEERGQPEQGVLETPDPDFLEPETKDTDVEQTAPDYTEPATEEPGLVEEIAKRAAEDMVVVGGTVMQIARTAADMALADALTLDMASISDADLVLECIKRGYTVKQ